MKKISNGVYALELEMERLGQASKIYPLLLSDGDTSVLIDAGLPTSIPEIEAQLGEIGLAISNIDAFVLTHQDLDHIGGLPALVELASEGVDVVCHEAEKPFIEGTKQFSRLDPETLKITLDSMPESLRSEMQQLVTEAKAYKGVTVTSTVDDGDVLPFGGGITVIHTPGHTEGHLCFYLNKSGILVAGDELDLIDGELFGPKHGLSADEDEAYESIAKLTKYDIKDVLCYHGGLFTGNARERIAELANVVPCGKER